MYHMWDMHNRTTEEQARINRGRINNGKIFKVEDTTPLYDANDVSVSVESSGMVYDTARPNESTGSTCQCGDGGNDRCVCGMDESRG